MERPFTDADGPDSETRGRLGGASDLGGLGGGPIGGSVPAGLGGSMGGLLGSGEHWGPGRPRRLHSQRRYRARGGSRPERSPAVEGWVRERLSFCLLSPPFVDFMDFCSASQNCTAVSHQPFCQLWSSRLASLLMVRWHMSVTCLLVFLARIGLLTVFSLHQDRDVALKPRGLCMGTRRVRCCDNTGMWNAVVFYSKAPSYGKDLILHVFVWCSYSVSWKTQALLQQKKRRSLLSQLLISLRNKQVSKRLLSHLSLMSSGFRDFPFLIIKAFAS